MTDNLKTMLSDIRQALGAYEGFVDKMAEVNETLFQEANRLSGGGARLSATYFKNGARPLDRLNVLEGYLLAKLGE